MNIPAAKRTKSAFRGNLISRERKGRKSFSDEQQENYFNLQKLHIKAKQNFRKRYQEMKKERQRTLFVHLISAIKLFMLHV